MDRSFHLVNFFIPLLVSPFLECFTSGASFWSWIYSINITWCVCLVLTECSRNNYWAWSECSKNCNHVKINLLAFNLYFIFLSSPKLSVFFLLERISMFYDKLLPLKNDGIVCKIFIDYFSVIRFWPICNLIYEYVLASKTNSSTEWFNK